MLQAFKENPLGTSFAAVVALIILAAVIAVGYFSFQGSAAHDKTALMFATLAVLGALSLARDAVKMLVRLLEWLDGAILRYTSRKKTGE